MTLPTDERVVGDPRCCWSATAGGSPSIAIDVGHRHLVKETPGVGRNGFEITSLRLGVECTECQRRLARTRHASEDDERIARQVQIDILEIMLPRPPHTHKAGELGAGGLLEIRRESLNPTKRHTRSKASPMPLVYSSLNMFALPSQPKVNHHSVCTAKIRVLNSTFAAMKATAMAQADVEEKTVAPYKLVLTTGDAMPEPSLIYSLPTQNGP